MTGYIGYGKSSSRPSMRRNLMTAADPTAFNSNRGWVQKPGVWCSGQRATCIIMRYCQRSRELCLFWGSLINLAFLRGKKSICCQLAFYLLSKMHLTVYLPPTLLIFVRSAQRWMCFNILSLKVSVSFYCQRLEASHYFIFISKLK